MKKNIRIDENDYELISEFIINSVSSGDRIKIIDEKLSNALFNFDEIVDFLPDFNQNDHSNTLKIHLMTAIRYAEKFTKTAILKRKFTLKISDVIKTDTNTKYTISIPSKKIPFYIQSTTKLENINNCSAKIFNMEAIILSDIKKNAQFEIIFENNLENNEALMNTIIFHAIQSFDGRLTEISKIRGLYNLYNEEKKEIKLR